MPDYSILERNFCDILRLPRRPVAIAFRESPPAGVAKFAGSQPSGCSFWQLASGGMTFYTIPGDHCNCAMGSFTHSFPVTPERVGELESAISIMSSSGYIKMEEISSIPRLKEVPKAVIYSPLGDAPMDPDLVIFVARPMQIMMLQESAMHAGVGLQLSLFGGPTCLSLPAALGNHGMITSAGCLGNRVYNDLGDDELYVVIPGRILQKVADEVQEISESTENRIKYHKGRRKSIRTPLE